MRDQAIKTETAVNGRYEIERCINCHNRKAKELYDENLLLWQKIKATMADIEKIYTDAYNGHFDSNVNMYYFMHTEDCFRKVEQLINSSASLSDIREVIVDLEEYFGSMK